MIWYPDILIVGQNESWCVAITRLLHRNTVVYRRLSYASKLTNSLSSSLSSRRRVVLVEAKLTVQRLTCRLVVREVEFIGSLAVLFLLTSLLQASLQFHRQPISTDFRFAGFNESRRKKEYDSPCFSFVSSNFVSREDGEIGKFRKVHVHIEFTDLMKRKRNFQREIIHSPLTLIEGEVWNYLLIISSGKIIKLKVQELICTCCAVGLTLMAI